MFATLAHAVMKPFMLVWLYTSPHSWRGLPLPESGSPIVVVGPDPQKVLVCGSGIVVGYGVASNELALGGSLARSLARLTNRGTEVETLACPRMTTKMAQSQLTPDALRGLDAVVLFLGTFDLLCFLPSRRWGSRMGELVDSVLASAEPSTQLFIVNCTAPKMSYFIGAYRRNLLKLTTAYNNEIEKMADQDDRVHQIHFAPQPQDVEAVQGRESYRMWAEQIAPDVVRGL